MNTFPTNIDQNDQTLPKYIVVEGPIGVGKSTLAKHLTTLFNYQSLLENTEKNPFLDKFYENQQQNGLATQLHFLFQRAKQLEQLQQYDLFEPAHIADFMIEKDRLFAQAILDEDEYKLYDIVYQQLSIQSPKPDLVIYLQAPTHVLAQRIQQRGLQAEQNIHTSYLELINQAYSQFFHYYDDAPLLIINASQIEVIYEENNFRQLINYILSIQSGRHYFNPSISRETLL